MCLTSRCIPYYQTLAALRRVNPVLTAGDLRMLFADDAAGVVAYGRKTTQQAALVVLNRSDQDRTVTIPVVGYLPDGLGAQHQVRCGKRCTRCCISSGYEW